MNTFLGASQFLPEAALDRDLIADAAILYLEGYLWDPEEPRAGDARRDRGRAQGGAQGRVHACPTRSASSAIGDDFRELIADGLIDILFANEAEIRALMQIEDFDAAVAAVGAAGADCWS